MGSRHPLASMGGGRAECWARLGQGFVRYSRYAACREGISLGWLRDHIVSDYGKGHPSPASNSWCQLIRGDGLEKPGKLLVEVKWTVH